ncbi:MAG: hypothetical protein ACFCUS_13365 [Rubrimonas sp.]|uniref:hypothetical protein n=1 Tax=Rubrimonas sp. TaxID=2036015 RepID=UPI002FDEE771
MNDIENLGLAEAARPASIALFVLGSAALYAAGMVAMKLWGQFPPATMATAIGICIAGAVWLEVLALRETRLGVVYVAILAAEAVMVAAIAHLGFDEEYSTRELVGGALIVAGVAVAAT